MPAINRDLLAPSFQREAAGMCSWSPFWPPWYPPALEPGSIKSKTGIGRTNLHPPIFWSAYIASFVYWIGVSHSGTFISGVLRLTKRNGDARSPGSPS